MGVCSSFARIFGPGERAKACTLRSSQRERLRLLRGSAHRGLFVSLVTLASLVLGDAASSQPPPQAYVWADSPDADLYFPSVFYSWNPGGGRVAITRIGTGVYSVFFQGLDAIGTDGGNVQVTPYSSEGAICKPLAWDGATVNVRCFDPTGSPADEIFTLLYTRAEPGTAGVAYAWVRQESEDSYVAPFFYAFNPGGGAVEILRTGPGIYTVTWDGFDQPSIDGGNVQVTAYGGGTNYCNVLSWGGDSVNVGCFDIGGVFADSDFTVLFTKPLEASLNLFYAWADMSDAPGPYEANSFYAYDASGGTTLVNRVGEGSYSVTFPGLDELGVENGAHVQVTGYGSSNRCETDIWFGEEVFVSCYDAEANNLADSNFSVLVVPEAGSLATALGTLSVLAGICSRRTGRRKSGSLESS